MKVRSQIESFSRELGFECFGVSSVKLPLRRQYYLDWIASGQHGDMSWLERNNDRRLNPDQILPGAKSILVFGMNYCQPQPDRAGRIAKYALGKDYHKILLKKLKRICTYLRENHASEQRPYVDTGPVLEKPIAELAGLGWQGKSSILLNEAQGTWLFLGIVVTTLELEPDKPAVDRCGSCTRCIDACPTDAITAPYQLDARRCIAYLTIEHKGAIPIEYRQAMGDRIFGCDECLDVCPWNRFAQKTREGRLFALDHPDARQSLKLTPEQFDRQFAGTPIRRLGLSRWLRNACVVLGNIGKKSDLPALKLHANGNDQLVAEHAGWAMEAILKK